MWKILECEQKERKVVGGHSYAYGTGRKQKNTAFLTWTPDPKD